MDNILISIITPVFNASKYLGETIRSVIDQTYQNWELILVDDGSFDNSRSIVEAFQKTDCRIQFYRHEANLGVAEARNTGVRHASGKYIAFIDSDDCWDKSKLDFQLKFMIENSCMISHTAYRKIDEDGNVLAERIAVSKSVNYQKLLKHNEIGLSTAMYNADLLGKRYFTTTGWEDFALWLEILKSSGPSLGINEPLVSYRIHSHSSSYNKLASAKKTWRVYRDVENLSFLKSTFYFLHYAINAGRKYMVK